MTGKEYLDKHSIKEETAQKMGWMIDDERGIIAIPIYDDTGKPLFYRYRNLKYEEQREIGNKHTSKFYADDGSNPMLYCLDKIKDEKEIVLCEGEPDCLRLWQEGIPATTGTSGVNTLKKEMVTPLSGKIVYVVLDTDEKGVGAIPRYQQILSDIASDIRFIDLPRKFKDISEYFSFGYTKDDFDQLKKEALNFSTWKANHVPEDYALESAHDIRQKELPEEKWLIKNGIPIEGFAFFVGPEASSKSFQALSIAKCVTTGEPWLPEKLGKDGKPFFQVMKKTKVLIMDKESTMRRIQDRLRGYDLDTDDIKFLAYPHKFEIAETDEEKLKKNNTGFTEFFETVALQVREQEIGLIILDSFTDFFIGEENDRGSIQKFFDAFRQMFPGIAIVVLHHAGKQQMGKQRPTSEMTRGSSNIMAQTYTAFYFMPDRKIRTEFIVEQTKAGDSLKINKFKIEIQTVDDPLHKDETLVTDFKYIGEIDDKVETISKATERGKEILEEAGRMFRKEFIEEMIIEKFSSKTAQNVLKSLEGDGLIGLDFSKVPGRTKEKEAVWKEGNEEFGEIVTG